MIKKILTGVKNTLRLSAVIGWKRFEGVKITNIEKIFDFKNYDDWNKNAQKRFKKYKVSTHDTVCIDIKGRLCISGHDFDFAEHHEGYPITVFKYVDPYKEYER